MKLGKMLYIIYGDIESLIKKIDGCTNNPEKSSTTKIGKHIPWRYALVNNLDIWSYIKQAYFISCGRYDISHAWKS